MRLPLFLLAFAASLPAQIDGGAGQNWPHYGGLHSFWRYSTLSQVNRSNVAKLTPKWVFQSGQIEGGMQGTPIVVDGVMYITTSFNRVYALDAGTGREIWRYSYQNPKDLGIIYGPWNRGVAVGQGKVFMGTLDNSVVALDQKSGREMWKVNVEPMAQCGCNITGAPLLVKDKVIVGVTGGDSAHRGYINAFDAKTGRQAWRFWTIPGPGEPGHDTWEGDSWKSGGGSSWMTGSYDPELNLVYWGVGNPAADFYGDSRKGKNLYTDSVVALDADTGKLKWYHQQVPHDVWDWDTAYECLLVDLPVKGKTRKLLINTNKGGYTFVVDRTNGEFISAWPVAQNINWIKGIDEKGNLIGRNEPPVGVPTVICPSIGGGRQWNQGSYSPKSGWLYTTGIEWCEDVTVQKEEPKEGKEFFGGVFKLRPPLTGAPGGHLDAYDPIGGKKHWTYPAKYPLLASILSTAGEVVFTGDAEGHFFALDGRSGAKLWSFQTGSGHRGGPIAYSVKGKQYVATPSGWGSAVAGLMSQLWPEAENFRGGSAVFVFGLAE
ncbi:MAG: PQQ-dependent dehydrogenase, methanol/ethanol family [Acidobacteria bacterium]|nr:PQQ-dependent dehydrogenase, methanol/ethanol family [Acidobacteriota bacterium]MBI3474085.1 PQQ-dependent dehydrogenase, methanol/ethanol family [Candidatus Solibacter usitatus]